MGGGRAEEKKKEGKKEESYCEQQWPAPGLIPKHLPTASFSSWAAGTQAPKPSPAACQTR